ncbi:hypothetical protein A3D83_03535 [Candidatus Daviesbacteria bacterium RIFCSPHIGHO2_02_FULL_41_10]|uniref:Uncharacterized protein n=1 Tax=Candidatus Daviesbacteria bacterium RIFCSPHIGHO2_02_FULL_41_10 TaxID=1797774 RepID=A0A1F5JUM1_9BACT|nr:MAG: hypothetical protein A3D83_03535 [Candidatus Daviesbacteria bacterium RIFCSPHIGHO2_02_FULL_41_10]
MTEGITRGDLPRMKDPNFRVARVVSTTREKVDGKLPPLMDDTRAHYLALIRGDGEDIYVKAVASPWTGEHGIHLMVIPDRKDHQNIPGITDLSPEALGKSIRLAESLGFHMLQQPEISEVDFGINHSRSTIRTLKSHLASIPQNLHVHITGYNPRDLVSVSNEDIMKSADLTGRTAEALYVLGEELLFEEIVPALRSTFPDFDAIFSEIKDSRARRRFNMNNGRDGFAHPDLPKILQALDVFAKQKYDELAQCFFKNHDKKNQLLPRGDRLRNIDEYISKHKALSGNVKLGLKFLAAIAKDRDIVVQRELGVLAQKKGDKLTETEEEIATRKIANRFWAYEDLAYALVWSAKKEDNGQVNWIMGFDPKIFTIHGPHQSSAYTNKLVERDISGYFSDEQLSEAQKRENAVILQTRGEVPSLEVKE